MKHVIQSFQIFLRPFEFPQLSSAASFDYLSNYFPLIQFLDHYIYHRLVNSSFCVGTRKDDRPS